MRSSDIIARDGLRLWRRWLGAALRNDLRRCFSRATDPSPAFPAHFLVSVTYRCDSRCTHCGIWTLYRKEPESVQREMTLVEFERFLDVNPQLIQTATTGGEQFNRDDIEEFWLAMDRRGYRTSCATNALETDRIIEREGALLSRLSGRHLRNFAVSLDGLEATHNRIRGTPDGKLLYVADIGARKTYRYKINPDGTLSDKTLFCSMGSDGMTMDNEGNLYLTGRGVTVFNPEGQQIDQIPIDKGWTANVAFGGKNRDTLFITASDSLFAIKTRVKGAY